MMHRLILAALLLLLLTGTALAGTTEQMSKLNGYTVLQQNGDAMSKLNGYTVLQQNGIAMSKLNAYAVLCAALQPRAAAAGSDHHELVNRKPRAHSASLARCR
jgi:hypothetical protein